MRKLHSSLSTFIIFLVLTLAIGIQSCDPDFLDKTYEPEQYVTDAYYVSSTPQVIPVRVNVGVTNKNWHIIQYPDYINPYTKSGVTSAQGIIELMLTVYDNIPEYSVQEQMVIVEIEGYGLLGIPFKRLTAEQLNNNGALTLSTASVEITNSAQSSFNITAGVEKDLFWEIISVPYWVNINSNSFGWLEKGRSKTIDFAVNARGLPEGQYEGIIKIRYDGDKFISFIVTLNISVITKPTVNVSGQLIGCAYLKDKDLLLVVTKSPNRILTYTDENSEAEIVELSRVPKSMALSEDQSTLAISFTNTEITTYNAQTKSEIKTYNLDVIPECLAFGSEEYLYFLSARTYNSSYTYINSLNLTTGIIVTSNDDEGGYKYLKKVPNKNIIVTSKKGWSPEFIVLYYDTHLGEVNKMNEYRDNPNGLWPSDDGNQLFGGNEGVYNVPEYVENLSYLASTKVEGQIDLPNDMSLLGLDTNSSLQKICAVTESSSYRDKLNIKVFDKQTLAEQKSIDVNLIKIDYTDYWSYLPSGAYLNTDCSKVWILQSFPDRDDDALSTWRVLRVDLE